MNSCFQDHRRSCVGQLLIQHLSLHCAVCSRELACCCLAGMRHQPADRDSDRWTGLQQSRTCTVVMFSRRPFDDLSKPQTPGQRSAPRAEQSAERSPIPQLLTITNHKPTHPNGVLGRRVSPSQLYAVNPFECTVDRTVLDLL
eukprot:COSAG02_NODE_3825_length_6182_cov_5.458491_5_plen_143_part_00